MNTRELKAARKSAKTAGLVYVTDEKPGIARVKKGKTFSYTRPGGKSVKDKGTLSRIMALVIPPAWKEVWICPDPRGHLQATGRDARGRKQSRYHPAWREVRDENKYEHLKDFARALPRIRRATARHLRERGLGREKVLAAVVQLLEKTLIRVGNDEYARNNESFGLTTMRDRHVSIRGKKVRFAFKGKSNVNRDIEFNDARLARIVARCQDLPGYELFQYIDDDGVQRDVTSADVNEYLREITGENFTAKDFRTWAGTLMASTTLREVLEYDSEAQAKKHVVAAIDRVAKQLGNTRAVCRKCYIHPTILETYMDGTMAKILQKKAERQLRQANRLSADEAMVVTLIQQKLKRVSANSRAA